MISNVQADCTSSERQNNKCRRQKAILIFTSYKTMIDIVVIRKAHLIKHSNFSPDRSITNRRFIIERLQNVTKARVLDKITRVTRRAVRTNSIGCNSHVAARQSHGDKSWACYAVLLLAMRITCLKMHENA